MKEYLYLFRGGDVQEVQNSPDKMQDHMQKWMQWMGQLGEKGILKGGQPLEQGGSTVSNGGSVVTDGPFAEGKEVVGGYLLITANDLEEAVEISKGCPIHEHQGTVEVRPIAALKM